VGTCVCRLSMAPQTIMMTPDAVYVAAPARSHPYENRPSPPASPPTRATIVSTYPHLEPPLYSPPICNSFTASLIEYPVTASTPTPFYPRPLWHRASLHPTGEDGDVCPTAAGSEPHASHAIPAAVPPPSSSDAYVVIRDEQG
jgi:hypothetical protein